jgi:hypothetical protein
MTAPSPAASAVERHAWIAGGGRYRYELERRWGPGEPLVWVMLNPSTADAFQDDPTIRRIVRFTVDACHNALLVVNLYALRATDPALMLSDPNRVGPLNDKVLARARHRGPIVAAWGAGAQPARVFDVLEGPLAGVHVSCLGTTKKGHPRHPLYVPADQPLTPYRRASP